MQSIFQRKPSISIKNLSLSRYPVSRQFTLPPSLCELWRDKQKGWIFVRTNFTIPYCILQPFPCFYNEVTDDMTVADFAVLVYLHNPEKLNEIDVEFSATKKKSFAMRATRRDLTKPSCSEKGKGRSLCCRWHTADF